MQQRAAVDADGKPPDRSAARFEIADLAHRDVFARRGFVVRLLCIVQTRGNIQLADDRARFKDVKLLPQLIHQQRVFARRLHLEQNALFHIALHFFRVQGFHIRVVRLRAVVGVGLDQHIAVAVRVLFQHMHALALPVQFARAVLLIGFAIRARCKRRIDVFGLPHIHHCDGLHHQIPNGLLMVGIGQIVFVWVHVPETRRLWHGTPAIFIRRRLPVRRLAFVPDLRFLDAAFPNLRFLNIEAVQIQRVRHAGNRRVRFPDGQRQQAFFALFAPVVAQLNRNRVNTVRRLASVGQNAVPDQLSAPRVHLRRAQIDGFAFRAAQLHRQRAALRCLKGNRPSSSGVQALAVRRHIRQLRRGLRTGRRHQQQENHP